MASTMERDTTHPQQAANQDVFAFWGALSIMALACVYFRFDGATPDVSWLISMCERIYDGEIAYIDIFETTPPVPTLLYMPGVALSRWLPVSAEAAVYASAFASIIVSFILSVRILPERIGGIGPSRWLVLFPSAVFLFIIANDAFAQREYFSAVFALPVVCVFIRHAEDEIWPDFSSRAWAAILAGLSIAIKPPLFVLPGVVLAAYYLFRVRNVRFLYSSGLLAAGAIGVLITIISLMAFPAYLDGVTTLMRDVYVPLRLPLLGAAGEEFYGVLAVFIITAILSLDRKIPAAGLIALAATLGYLIVYVAQGKFFGYHLVPAAMFGLIALTIFLWKRAMSQGSQGPKAALSLSIYAIIGTGVSALMYAGFEDGRPRMQDMQWAEDLDRPTAMAISPIIGAGFPLSRQIEARWVDRIHSQWVANYTRYALENIDLTDEEEETARRYFAFDIERTRNTIRDEAPEIIIQTVSPKMQWLHEAVVEAHPSPLENYTVIADDGYYRIWRRRDSLAASTTVTGGAGAD